MNNFENILTEISGSTSELPSEITEALGNMGFIVPIIASVVFVFLAFYSYKIFKICLFLFGLVGGYFAGSMYVAPLVEACIPTTVDKLDMICGIVCGVIAGVLAIVIYKLAIFAGSAFLTFTVTSPILTIMLEPLSADIEKIGIGYEIVAMIAAGLIGVLVGIIVLKLFKPVYIVSTAVGFSVSAVEILVIGLLGMNIPLLALAAIGGNVLGVFACITQFKMNRDK